MKCPSCQMGELQNSTIDNLFPCKTCDHCNGNWLLLKDYMYWKNYSTQKPPIDKINIPISETKNAIICPVSGTLMIKYRITNEVENRIDYSRHSAAIWLDHGEWQLIKKLGLAYQLNEIFTTNWQKKVKDEASSQFSDKCYIERFGEEDYKKIKEIRDWLTNHPQSHNLYNYLNAFAKSK